LRAKVAAAGLLALTATWSCWTVAVGRIGAVATCKKIAYSQLCPHLIQALQCHSQNTKKARNNQVPNRTSFSSIANSGGAFTHDSSARIDGTSAALTLITGAAELFGWQMVMLCITEFNTCIHIWVSAA